jgi:hypothetical protein
MTKATNDHERFNRARKVSAIVEFLDFTLEATGFNPILHPVEIAAAVARLSKEDWERAADKCGQNAPSPTSIGQIVSIYQHRAQAAQRVAS